VNYVFQQNLFNDLSRALKDDRELPLLVLREDPTVVRAGGNQALLHDQNVALLLGLLGYPVTTGERTPDADFTFGGMSETVVVCVRVE
jgi:hypothetical protein